MKKSLGALTADLTDEVWWAKVAEWVCWLVAVECNTEGLSTEQIKEHRRHRVQDVFSWELEILWNRLLQKRCIWWQCVISDFWDGKGDTVSLAMRTAKLTERECWTWAMVGRESQHWSVRVSAFYSQTVQRVRGRNSDDKLLCSKSAMDCEKWIRASWSICIS